jgi:hypothetical protein
MILTILMVALLAMAILVASLEALRPKAEEEIILPEMVESLVEVTGGLEIISSNAWRHRRLTGSRWSLVESNYTCCLFSRLFVLSPTYF